MTTDFPTKNKTRAKRRKHKMTHRGRKDSTFRSPYAKELETHKYRQRIKQAKVDDWSWMDDIEEYHAEREKSTELIYNGLRDMESPNSTQESHQTADTTTTTVGGRGQAGQMVETGEGQGTQDTNSQGERNN